MTKRPTSITILSLYLLVVFNLSLIMSVFGAVQELPPYSREIWLSLMVPKVFAIAAGIAFWRMLRVGVWLWVTGVVLGWAIAIAVTGFFPNLTSAAAISVVIVGISVWIIATNWQLLRPLSSASANVEAAE